MNITAPSQNETQPASQAAVDTAKHPAQAPLLENVVAAICLDARQDSLRYALRSNVGHDGE